jgi:hypothetical protein
MDKELVEEVKTFLRAEPRRFDMSGWIANYYGDAANAPPCGTVCCIAGAVLILRGVYRTAADYISNPSDPAELAAELLGISDGSAENLFSSARWPEELWLRYKKAVNAGDKRQQVEIACERLDYMVETGE